MLKDYKIVHEAMFLIRPPTSTFLFTHIHGLTWDSVKDAQTFDQVWETGIEPWYSKSKKLIAHNVSFDQRVLHSSGAHYGIKIPRMKTECTVKLSRYHLGIKPGNLANVSKTLEIKLNHHEALSDARASAFIYIHAKTGEKPWLGRPRGEQLDLDFSTPPPEKPRTPSPLETLDPEKAFQLNSPKSAALLKELLSKKTKSIKMDP